MLFIIAFFSGAAALIYEVTWSRQIGLLLGHTTDTAAVVLAAFFVGLACGYRLAASAVHRVRPLIGYAVAEAWVGLWAALIPTLLIALDFAVPDHFFGRFLFVGLILLPATAGLGASLPFLAEYFASRSTASRDIPLAYTSNTVGACIGVVLTTSILIARFGVNGTARLAVGLTLACAAAAFILDLATRPKRLNHTERVIHRIALRWHALAAFSGFGLLALQTLYTRMFSLVFHNSVYSFGAVVAAFLVALALAAAWVSRWDERFEAKHIRWMSLQAGGIAVAVSMLGFIAWTRLEYFSAGTSFFGYVGAAMGLALTVLIVPIVLLGSVLPWTWRVAGADHGHSVGMLTCTNAMGAALGAVFASFVLLPTIGLWGGIASFAGVYVAAAAIMGCKNMTVRDAVSHLLGALVCVAAFFAANSYDGVANDQELLMRRESAYGWIDVVRSKTDGGLDLRQNIHYTLGSTNSSAMERRQGHMPLLLHPAPRQVLFIGLATGITAGTALDHESVETVEVAELIPDVVAGAAMFATANRGIVNAERASITVGDGRRFLSRTSKTYDVIVSDLFVPWESQTGYLYTEEMYQAARRRLTTGGLFCQWLPLWQVSERELRIIADTFAAVFPFVTVWYGREHERWTVLGLVGSEEPIVLDAAALAARLAGKASFDSTSPESADALVASYAGDWLANPRAELNTEDMPRVEFYTPVSVWTPDLRLRFDALATFRQNVLDKLPRGEGVVVVH